MKELLPGQKDRSKYVGPLIPFEDGSRGDLRRLNYEGLKQWLAIYKDSDRFLHDQIEAILAVANEENYRGIIEAFYLGIGYAMREYDNDMRELVDKDRADAGRAIRQVPVRRYFTQAYDIFKSVNASHPNMTIDELTEATYSKTSNMDLEPNQQKPEKRNIKRWAVKAKNQQ